MKNKIIKELFIIALLAVVTVFVVGILLYEYVPTKQELPVPIEYTADSSVTATLKEIEENQDSYSAGNNGENEEQSLLQSYTIDKSDLKDYERRKAFTSGKVDPFADYVETTNETVIDNTTVISGNTVKPESGNFFNDNGKK